MAVHVIDDDGKLAVHVLDEDGKLAVHVLDEDGKLWQFTLFMKTENVCMDGASLCSTLKFPF